MLDEQTKNTVAAIPTEAIAALARQVQGQIMLPGDEEFEGARRVHVRNDAMPALIVRCTTTADVAATIAFAREQHLALAVRGGGHSLAHYGTVDGGVVLDLSPMKTLEIDPARRTARLGAGLTWGEVAEALQPHGLALTAGDAASVGVGGLALGGGIGWFVRKYGLTIDRIRAIEVVTADGQTLIASATEHPDLFWALRGGGGNFGVATAFEVELHQAGMIYGGAIFYDAQEAATVLPAFARYLASAPEELTAMALLKTAPPAPFMPPSMHGKPVLALTLAYSGDPVEGARVVDPLRRLGTPIADIVRPMPYPALFEFTREMGQRHVYEFGRSVLVERVDDALTNALLDGGVELPSSNAVVQVRILGGAMARVPADATAFAHRDKGALIFAGAFTADAEVAERNRAWVLGRYEAIRRFGSGVYMNSLGGEPEEEARLGEAYPPATLARLRQIKRRYDPANLFQVNLNIPPAEE